MNTKTFIILFLLGISCSCSWHYETTFGGDDEVEQKQPIIPEKK
jgi:hypothetical protein